jgi:uncharacterized protein (DUF849 family)
VSPKINHDGAVLDLVNARLAGQNPAVPKVGRPSRDEQIVAAFREQIAARGLNRFGLPTAAPAAATTVQQAETVQGTTDEPSAVDLMAWNLLSDEERDEALADPGSEAYATWRNVAAGLESALPEEPG